MSRTALSAPAVLALVLTAGRSACEEGEDARLLLGIADSGGTDDELMDVTGPGFPDPAEDVSP